MRPSWVRIPPGMPINGNFILSPKRLAIHLMYICSLLSRATMQYTSLECQEFRFIEVRQKKLTALTTNEGAVAKCTVWGFTVPTPATLQERLQGNVLKTRCSILLFCVPRSGSIFPIL